MPAMTIHPPRRRAHGPPTTPRPHSRMSLLEARLNRPLTSPYPVPSSTPPKMVRAASHTELRQRSQAFANKAGKSNPLKKATKPSETQKTTIPRWLFIVFFLLLAGGLFFEIGQLVLDQIWPPVTKYKQPRRP
ncbi:BZ3500_MvSof-1268-A1-R1_Chr3-1g06034 [Microbotryum saponariae]|uniref:BZ3500_MvSof-1268-A1-R1_Chr3-1g06034 protein n=1 Tax=Microbotryum saponariae TaxID=289078 RepID=A0A2X0LT25_9BASI|nr:BZ3500_MvSof-1268-A1-R1_Chr3-1g06034 [Microbotryum saponariae]SDA03838.1 BZ3501_MvSof-1269-A2-R1_Chr3-2g05719 [Microbotryum saponariae]